MKKDLKSLSQQISSKSVQHSCCAFISILSGLSCKGRIFTAQLPFMLVPRSFRQSVALCDGGPPFPIGEWDPLSNSIQSSPLTASQLFLIMFIGEAGACRIKQKLRKRRSRRRRCRQGVIFFLAVDSRTTYKEALSAPSSNRISLSATSEAAAAWKNQSPYSFGSESVPLTSKVGIY